MINYGTVAILSLLQVVNSTPITIPQGSQAADNQNEAITVGVESEGSALGSIIRVGGVGLQTYTANVTIAKPVLSFSVVPTYSTNMIPGETQSYALTITNTGHAATSGNSTVTWKYDNTNLTSENATGGSASSGTATWTVSSIIASTGTVTVNFSAVIEQASNNGTGVPDGTTITNGSTGSKVDYNDGLHTYSVNVASTTAFNVGTARGTSITRWNADSTANPGTPAEYKIRIKNTGNIVSNINLTDIQNGGDLNNAAVYSLTPGGSAMTLPVSVAQGDTLLLYVKFVISASASDGNTNIRTVTVTAQGTGVAPFSGQNPSTTSITTTVTAANITVVLSDSAAAGNIGTVANPAPGDVIYYIVRITNGGTGNATSVTSSNVNAHISANFNAYVANSVEVDADYNNTFEIGPITDGATASGITVNVTSGTVAVTFGTLPAAATRVYRYRVAVQ
jgi:hypothetical protein